MNTIKNNRTLDPAVALPAMEKELAALQERIEQTKKEVVQQAALKERMVTLQKEFGVDSIDEFLGLLYRHAGKTMDGMRAIHRRKGKVTDTLRDQIVAMVKHGISGSKIRSMTGLSLPTIQRVKSDFGLVHRRKHIHAA